MVLSIPRDMNIACHEDADNVKRGSGGSFAVTEFCWITLNINAMDQISSSLA